MKIHKFLLNMCMCIIFLCSLEILCCFLFRNPSNQLDLHVLCVVCVMLALISVTSRLSFNVKLEDLNKKLDGIKKNIEVLEIKVENSGPWY